MGRGKGVKYDYIQQGDCLELLKDIPDNSIDLVIIDPPYEFATDGGGGAFGAKKKKYRKELTEISDGFVIEILDELLRVLKKANIYVWCSKTQVRKLLDYFEDKGLYIDILTWHKTNPTPACNVAYLSDTEYLIFARETGVKVNGSVETKRKWYVTPCNKKDKDTYHHPTIKPLEIIRNLIINSSNEGDIVLDAFLGSGTTAVAAATLDRHYIGFELNPEYFEICQKRLAEIGQGQTADNEQMNIFDFI